MSESELDAIATAEKAINNITLAINYAALYGTVDGGHHKMWVIDQMIRALTDCPIVETEAVDWQGNTYTYRTQGESAAYRKVIGLICAGEDGPNTHEWDTGVAP